MNEETKLYPIAETFTSPQGEGVYCGTMMYFIRLAGCTVGKRFPKEMYQERLLAGLPARLVRALPIYTEQCTLYDGRTFACDTDYRMHKKMTVKQILDEMPGGVEHICITGGEPFMHDLRPFFYQTTPDIMLHVETSGTIPIEKAFGTSEEGVYVNPNSDYLWITVSPKLGALAEMIGIADEIKILVDENFDPDKLPVAVMNHKVVFIQPINGEFDVNPNNLKRVMELQKEFPHWRVSLQLHKVLSHYCQELVR